MVRDLLEVGEDPHPHSIAEFFILRRYRRSGVGAEAARQIFNALPPGKWVVAQTLTNTPAQRFWRAVIGAYTEGRFSERQDDRHNIIEFTTAPLR